MKIEVAAIANCDDAVVFWKAAHIPTCLGFALERELERPGAALTRSYVRSYRGFADYKPREGEYRPSSEWPM